MELRKHIGHRRFLLLAVFMILLSGVLFFRDNRNDATIKRQIKWQKQEETYQKHYASYIDSIINENKALSGISIFAKKNSTAQKRSKIARKKYQAMKEITLSDSHGEGLEKVLRFQSVHGLLMIVMIVLTLGFLDHDYQSLALIVASTPKGRSILAMKRMGVLLIVSLGLHMIAYTLLLGEGIVMFGMPQFNVSAQSLSYLKDMTLPISLGAFYLLYIMVSSFCMALLSLVFWDCLIAFHTRSLGLGLFLGLSILEVLLQSHLIAQSPIAFLKYNNIYYLLMPIEIMRSFLTYTCLKQMVNGQHVFVIVMLTIAVLLIIFTVLDHQYHRVLSQSHTYKLKKLIQKVTIRVRSRMSLHKTFFQECYKIVICERGLLYIICFGILLVSLQDTTPYLANDTMNTYQTLYAKYGGAYDGRIMKEYIIPMHKKYQKRKRSYEKISALYDKGKVTLDRLSGEETLLIAAKHEEDIASTIEAQIKDIQKLSQKGIKANLIDQKGWTILLSKDGHYPGEGYYSAEAEGMITIALMCFLLSSLWYYDRKNRMNLIIRTTPQGRDSLYYMRLKIMALLALLAVLSCEGMDFYVLAKTYPLTSWNAPVRSLLFLNDLPVNMPIWCFLIILTLLRMFSLFSLCMLMNCLFMFAGGLKGAFISVGVLVIPQVLSSLGLSFFHYLSAVQLITIMRMEQELGFAFTTLILLVLYGSAAIAIYFSKQLWNGKKGKIVWS